ncbi:MAG: lipoyl(octanoyl) transferase LipB [Candidatus Omnitrophica bacterium]|nr:lipoyl(octanoyl) transferase LipB [Candidatus Omnitrophota bacterium]
MSIEILDLGLVGYEEFLVFQNELLGKRARGEAGDTLIIAEHFPVVTLGRLSAGEWCRDIGYFKTKNIDIIQTSRGGKNTCHSPGQLLIYPVIDLSKKLKDIGHYLNFLENSLIGALRELGIDARINGTRRGVWVGPKKIAFIGVAVKSWITFHGASVNINNDLEPFSLMDPCGEQDIKVTSAREILGKELDMPMVKKLFARRFIVDIQQYIGNMGTPLGAVHV